VQGDEGGANYPNFKGTRAFTSYKGNNISRTKLPFLRPENEKIGVW